MNPSKRTGKVIHLDISLVKCNHLNAIFSDTDSLSNSVLPFVFIDLTQASVVKAGKRGKHTIIEAWPYKTHFHYVRPGFVLTEHKWAQLQWLSTSGPGHVLWFYGADESEREWMGSVAGRTLLSAMMITIRAFLAFIPVSKPHIKEVKSFASALLNIQSHITQSNRFCCFCMLGISTVGLMVIRLSLFNQKA